MYRQYNYNSKIKLSVCICVNGMLLQLSKPGNTIKKKQYRTKERMERKEKNEKVT